MLQESLSSLHQEKLYHNKKISNYLQECIRKSNGYLKFSSWMKEVLYNPNLGYYANESVSIKKDQMYSEKSSCSYFPNKDFVTAPELTPLFAQSLSKQVAQILELSFSKTILEFGAGSGKLAYELLKELDKIGIKADYKIVEIFPKVRRFQQEKLKIFGNRVNWLNKPPLEFCGCILANEVLDAMPVSIFRWSDDGTVLERGVGLDKENHFIWIDRPADKFLKTAVINRMPAMPGYISEINLNGEKWISSIALWLKRGAIILFDYGFPQCEYYHPQRISGTLMCHAQHHSHSNPLIIPGMQDITAHVDFTAIANSALKNKLNVLGYTTQAHFLINSGILERITKIDSKDRMEHYKRYVFPVSKLILETEMGELYKVLTIGRGIYKPLIGFTNGNRLKTL